MTTLTPVPPPPVHLHQRQGEEVEMAASGTAVEELLSDSGQKGNEVTHNVYAQCTQTHNTTVRIYSRVRWAQTRTHKWRGALKLNAYAYAYAYAVKPCLCILILTRSDTNQDENTNQKQHEDDEGEKVTHINDHFHSCSLAYA